MERNDLVSAGWCDGSGPGTPCGARAHVVEGDAHDEDRAAHACRQCGSYTPGADTHDGGLCGACWTDTQAAAE